ncbi:HNH endonuclease [Chitinispirillales bacterium ANBcel5]|uniref:HNH endonuclease n=1 Tax=Cellulosispirillum alkaliphilum TaxID=3039283 RepID=UPI002A532B2A|nr:HNH endonuclease [Chitinispirillales bacterium ANBcel5]
MKFYIGNTDLQWYNSVSALNPEDVNFWQPGGKVAFRVLEQGGPFLLKLKAPINRVAGIGFFTSFSFLPINFAWEIFGLRNGCPDLATFRGKIETYRGNANSLKDNPNIGCIVLTSPVFFDKTDWLPPPEDWASNIVAGKSYSTDTVIGRKYWEKIEAVLHKSSLLQAASVGEDRLEPQYIETIARTRIGQGAFRVMITDAYSRRCAVTGEKTLPVLEAAHIMPYSVSGINTTDNGLLLRADLHKLFDNGYITVTKNLRVEVSGRIREEFENGRDYYQYQGKELRSLPARVNDMPSGEFLEWHNDNVFR